MLLENIDGARHESGFRANGQSKRIEWTVERTEGRRLGFFVHFGGRRVLAFREAVNLIVEQQNFQADVAAQHVNGVIAADGKRVTVAGGNPHFEVRANRFDSSRNGGRTTVDGVKAKSVHVIREAAG